MIIKVITRHGEYIDLEFVNPPLHIPIDVEVIDEGEEE